MMDNMLTVSSSPHLSSGATTRKIMLDVIISLVPASIAATVFFGWKSLMLIAVCIISCVVMEFICRKVMKRKNTISDLSAVVTGLLLALNLPSGLNPLIAVFGCAVAIIAVKQMFGGIGNNFVNPAITARIVLLVSFPVHMTTWEKPFEWLNTADGVTGATPLALMGQGEKTGYLDLLLGNTGGCIGETCVIALLLGGIYLVARRVITPVIPLCFIGTVFVLSFILGQDPVFHILSGGVMLGAIFMATDYTTSPMNTWGKVIFGIGCGIITVLIRLYANLPEGVSFSIILMNILVPHIENLTKPRPFGKEKV
ncbi:MAG: RnfABCDGE type electron transport complex subunit D [Acutalibacteraceae bacterium]